MELNLFAEPPPAMSRRDILIVDDVPANLLAMEAALEPLARRIVTASSGREALARLLDEDFALIFLDVQMPDMDGFETARLIRMRERTRHTPIIFVTAHDRTEAAMLRGYSLGAVDFLYKPLHTDVLRAKARALVEIAEAQARDREAALLNQRELFSVHEARAQARRSEAQASTATAPLRAIVIEDDDDVRELTADLLALHGHQVMTASSGQKGLELLCAYGADVALIDLGLPDIDGCEGARRVREVCPDARTRLVATTGYSHEEDRVRAAQAGFDVHLAKPMRFATLLAAISPRPEIAP